MVAVGGSTDQKIWDLQNPEALIGESFTSSQTTATMADTATWRPRWPPRWWDAMIPIFKCLLHTYWRATSQSFAQFLRFWGEHFLISKCQIGKFGLNLRWEKRESYDWSAFFWTNPSLDRSNAFPIVSFEIRSCSGQVFLSNFQIQIFSATKDFRPDDNGLRWWRLIRTSSFLHNFRHEPCLYICWQMRYFGAGPLGR